MYDINMLEGEIQRLYALLAKIKSELDSEWLNANILLSMSKPTKENLRGHAKPVVRNIKMVMFTEIVRFICYTVFQVVRSVLRSLYYKREYDEWFTKKQKIGKFLFVSHYFGFKSQHPGSDLFFGETPKEFYLNGLPISVVYLNHTNFKDVQKNANSKLEYLNVFLPRTISLSMLIPILYRQLRDQSRLISYGMATYQTITWEFNEILRIARNQMHPSTVSNVTNIVLLTEAVKQNQTKMIFFPIEGHAFESILIHEMQKLDMKIVLGAYQHAPLVNQQTGIYSVVSQLRREDYLLVSGKVAIQQLMKNVQEVRPQTIEYGSKLELPLRKIGRSSSMEKVKRNDTFKSVLFSPEGTIDATLTMMKIAKELALNVSSLNVVFRVHTHIHSIQELAGVDLVMPSNFHLSASSLDTDLSEALCCVYRSSSVSILGLFSGVEPIFFDEGSGDYLDVIPQEIYQHETFTKIDQLVEIVLQLKVKNDIGLTRQESDVRDVGTWFFSEKNDVILEEILNENR